MAMKYFGLQQYREEDAHLFKGREKDSQDLYDLIVHNEYTVCYADSGEGKSSLINAGVFPLLRRSMFFPIKIIFNQDDYKNENICFDEIVDKRIVESIRAYNENTNNKIEYALSTNVVSDSPETLEQKEQLEKYSWWKLRYFRPQIAGIDLIPVYVFDQFEEVFDRPLSELWTASFFSWLEEVSTDLCPPKIVSLIREKIGSEGLFPRIKTEKGFRALFSLRNEFVGELDYWSMQRFFIPAMKNNRFCLKPLTRKGAIEVMQQGSFDEEIIKDVIQNLTEKTNEDADFLTLPSVSALMLSIVCTSLENDGSSILNQSGTFVESRDRVNSIINSFYVKSIENLEIGIEKDTPSDNKDSEKESSNKEIEYLHIPKRHLRIIEESLIDDRGKRLRISVDASDKLNRIHFADKYLSPLERGRIIRVSYFGRHKNVELIHDRLAEIIYKRLKKHTESKVRNRGLLLLFGLLFFAVCGTLFLGINSYDIKNSTLAISRLKIPIVNSDDYRFCENRKFENNDIAEEFVIVEDGTYELSYCHPLKKIIVGNDRVNNVKIIVSSCPQLEEIRFDKELTDATVELRDSIKCSIYIGKEIKNISINGWYLERSDLFFDISNENSHFSLIDNILWDIPKKKIVYANSKSQRSVIFPSGINEDVVNYQGKSFYNKCKNFEYYSDDKITRDLTNSILAKKIHISSRVKSIESKAFMGQDSLEEVVFDADCRAYIGDLAFACCDNLKKVVLPKVLDGHLETDWVNNAFVECPKIDFFVQDNSQFKKDDHGIVWLQKEDGKETPVFFSAYSKVTDSISKRRFMPYTLESLDSLCSYNYKNVYYFNNKDANGASVIAINRSGSSELFFPPFMRSDAKKIYVYVYSSKPISKIHLPYPSPQGYTETKGERHRFSYEFVLYGKSEPSDVVLIVPKGCAKYYKSHPAYQEFKMILEEQSYLSDYKNLIIYIYWTTKQWFNIQWYEILVGFIVGIIIFSLLVYILSKALLFNSKRKEKQKVEKSRLILLNILFVLLGLSIYTVFYWLFTFLLGYKIYLNNILAIVVTVTISTLFIYLLFIAGDWNLFIKEVKKAASKKTIKAKAFSSILLRIVRSHFLQNIKKYLGCAIGIAIILGGVNIIRYCQSRNIISYYIKKKDWKMVSSMAYDKLMNLNNIDSQTAMWARSLFLQGCQDGLFKSIVWENSTLNPTHDYQDDGVISSWSDGVIKVFDYNSELAYVSSEPYSSNYYVSSSFIVYYDFYRDIYSDSILVEPYRQSNIKPFGKEIGKKHIQNMNVLNDKYIVVVDHDSLSIFDVNNFGIDVIYSGLFKDYRTSKERSRIAWKDESDGLLCIFDASKGVVEKMAFPLGYNSICEWSIYNTLYLWDSDSKNKSLFDIKNKKLYALNSPYSSSSNEYSYLVDDLKGDSSVVYVSRDNIIERDTICVQPGWGNCVKKTYVIDEGKNIYYHIPSRRTTPMLFGNIKERMVTDSTLVLCYNDSVRIYGVGDSIPFLISSFKDNRGTIGKIDFDLFWRRGLQVKHDDKDFYVNDPLSGRELLKISYRCPVKDIVNNYIVAFNEGDSIVRLYGLDGSNVPMQFVLGHRVKENTKTWILKNSLIVYTKDDRIVEIHHIPTLEETVKHNKYLTEKQKIYLLNKLYTLKRN